MPKFTISTHETDPGAEVVEADLDFPSNRAAIEDARLALGELARDTLQGRSHCGFHTEVKDHTGRVLYRGSLTFASHTSGVGDDLGPLHESESRSDH